MVASAHLAHHPAPDGARSGIGDRDAGTSSTIRKIPGTENPATLHSLENLAHTLRDIDELPEAEAICKELWATRIRALPGRPPGHCAHQRAATRHRPGASPADPHDATGRPRRGEEVDDGAGSPRSERRIRRLSRRGDRRAYSTTNTIREGSTIVCRARRVSALLKPSTYTYPGRARTRPEPGRLRPRMASASSVAQRSRRNGWRRSLQPARACSAALQRRDVGPRDAAVDQERRGGHERRVVRGQECGPCRRSRSPRRSAPSECAPGAGPPARDPWRRAPAGAACSPAPGTTHFPDPLAGELHAELTRTWPARRPWTPCS